MLVNEYWHLYLQSISSYSLRPSVFLSEFMSIQNLELQLAFKFIICLKSFGYPDCLFQLACEVFLVVGTVNIAGTLTTKQGNTFGKGVWQSWTAFEKYSSKINYQFWMLS